MKAAVSCAVAFVMILPQASPAETVASLADGRTGQIQFQSVSPRGPSELISRSHSTTVTLVTGTLALPASVKGTIPVMVIAHGSGGILPGRENAWAARLNAIGVATFVIESFAARGIQSTSRDQARLSTMANLADTLAALRLVATHPRIDPARIGVMGFSRGGQAALYSLLDPLRRGMIDGNLRFAAHVALYPSCSIPYRSKDVGAAPTLMLLGGDDDYTPPGACRDYAAWFVARGVPVETITYEGAFHDFDIPAPPRFLPELQSARGCKAEVDVDSGTVQRLDSGERIRDPAAIATYFRSCMQRGATIGGNPDALARAQHDVAAFLRRAFDLPAQ